MDFWSRLIGGIGATQSKQSASNNPQRFARFKKVYNQILQTWHKQSASGSKPDTGATALIQAQLQRLNDTLRQDIRAPSPRLCVSFAASSKIYVLICTVACTIQNEYIIKEAVTLLSELIDSEEEEFLSNRQFARSLTLLVDLVVGSGLVIVHDDIEADIMELTFNVAAKIRSQPDLLPVWFTSRADDERQEGLPVSEIAKINSNDDFPLCLQFVGRVYREGRVGDFARTGLLYIFETAPSSPMLEDWIVESDLPTLMASGLGALYSQLSRKLTIDHPDVGRPLILALADNSHPPSARDAENFFSDALQDELNTFISYLNFWQDIMEHCRSIAIKQTLMDHFQIFFLQQILYPSLLQSSDVDGGSSVAVLTYLWRILDSVEHPDMIHLTLHYLLAMPEPLNTRPMTPRSPIAEKRRRSLLEFGSSGADEDLLTPSFFNLVDLCLASLRSSNLQTVTAALRLVSTIISKHHGYAVNTLIRTSIPRKSSSQRSIGVLHQEVEDLLTLARSTGGEQGMDEAYDMCLKDGLGLLESHICSSSILHVGDQSGDVRKLNRDSILTEGFRPVQAHALSSDDPLLRELVGILTNFFTNDVEVNLGVTNAISQLASCPYLSLEGWLATNASAQTPEEEVSSPILTTDTSTANEAEPPVSDEEKAEQARILAYKTALRRPRAGLPESSASVIVATLRDLTVHLKQLTTTIPELPLLLASRKRAFVGAAEHEKFTLSPTLLPLLSPFTSATPSRDHSVSRLSLDKPRPRPLNLSPGKAGGGPESPRPASPRGRALQAVQQRTLALSPSTHPKIISPVRLESQARMMSPARKAHLTGGNEAAATVTATADARAFDQKVRFSVADGTPVRTTEIAQGDPAAADGNERGEGEGDFVEASLNHVLTNAVILQEFILELAALMQIRASLVDGEIRFV